MYGYKGNASNGKWVTGGLPTCIYTNFLFAKNDFGNYFLILHYSGYFLYIIIVKFKHFQAREPVIKTRIRRFDKLKIKLDLLTSVYTRVCGLVKLG